MILFMGFVFHAIRSDSPFWAKWLMQMTHGFMTWQIPPIFYKRARFRVFRAALVLAYFAIFFEMLLFPPIVQGELLLQSHLIKAGWLTEDPKYAMPGAIGLTPWIVPRTTATINFILTLNTVGSLIFAIAVGWLTHVLFHRLRKPPQVDPSEPPR